MEHPREQRATKKSAIARISQSRVTLVGAALLALSPLLYVLSRENYGGHRTIDFMRSSTKQELETAFQRHAPMWLKDETVRGSWNRACELAESDLFAAGLELRRMEKLMTQRHIDPASLDYAEDYAALCRRAANAYAAYATSLVTPGGDGVSPYGRQLAAIREAATRTSEQGTARVTEQFAASDPQRPLLMAESLLQASGSSLDREALRPFVTGVLKENSRFIADVGAGTEPGRAAIRRSNATGHSYHPGGPTGAYRDALTPQEIEDMLLKLWDAVEEGAQAGEPRGEVQMRVAVFCLLARHAGIREKMQERLKYLNGADPLNEEELCDALMRQ